MKQMAQEREAYERTRLALEGRVKAAEQALWALLSSPMESWGDTAIWQLTMCEFAIEQINDTTSTAKQLQLAFRDACEQARHPSTVPRLRGSLQIDALRAAFQSSTLLRQELHRQLVLYKRLYCNLLSGFGRFRDVSLLPGEPLLALMKRTHDGALKWRPPGRPLSEQLGIKSKEGGRYMAEWREDTNEMQLTRVRRSLFVVQRAPTAWRQSDT